jgi:fructose-bisphosphate aldolase class II
LKKKLFVYGGRVMPIASYEQYCKMLESAYKNKYAYPAVNIASIEAANAALAGFAEAKSDGIIQVSIGGGEHASGQMIKDSALGAISLANHVHLLAERYNVYIALHTDHCRPEKLESFLYPLVKETEKRRSEGKSNLFQSHMFDGSNLPIEDNMRISKEILELCTKNQIILEVETGVVGGEEDGFRTDGVASSRLYTTPEEMLKVYETLKEVSGSIYMVAATFGNVHGVYKPGSVKLKPEILKQGQDAIKKKYGKDTGLYLVFHGGSGSTKEEIWETLEYGVVKMNIDTDTQYAFTRPIADHILRNYDGVLKIENEVGNKKLYDPRSYLKLAERNMSKRVVEACEVLRSAGRTLCG